MEYICYGSPMHADGVGWGLDTTHETLADTRRGFLADVSVDVPSEVESAEPLLHALIESAARTSEVKTTDERISETP